MGADEKNIANIVEECECILKAPKNSISSLLSCFGKLVSKFDYDPNKESIDKVVKESQFAIVYKYICEEKKSDSLTFKHNSNANAKATDFVNGLDKYLRNVCQSLINSMNKDNGTNNNYVTKLSDELKMTRGMTGATLAQALSTKLNRYNDSLAFITAVYDALQRGVTVSKMGELFANNYSVQLSGKKGYGGVIPRYREYIDRQKALNNFKV